MKSPTIIMLAGKGESTNIVHNYLIESFNIQKVIIEEPVPRSNFLKNRIKKLGFFKVLGQVLFQTFTVSYLKKRSVERTNDIKRMHQLNCSSINEGEIINVKSVNDNETVNILREIKPDIVIVNGTRIISKKVLNCVPAKFINMHAGITPMYRGVHGAYWALVENQNELCGTTIHFVDEGIDTGNILKQGIIQTNEKDNFYTYPLLQLAIGLPLLKEAIWEVLDNKYQIILPPKGESKLRSHPTLLEYWSYRLHRNVK